MKKKAIRTSQKRVEKLLHRERVMMRDQICKELTREIEIRSGVQYIGDIPNQPFVRLYERPNFSPIKNAVSYDCKEITFRAVQEGLRIANVGEVRWFRWELMS